MSAPQVFPVAPPRKAAWATMIGLGLLFPLLTVLVLIASGHAPREGTWSPVGEVLSVTTLLVLPLALLMRRRAIELHEGMLVLKAAMYTRRVPVAAIDLAAARILDLREHTALMPRWRTNGYSVPGFHAGYYRLREGGGAFCLLTDRSRVLVLPVPGDRTLLVSAEHPSAVLEALRQTAPDPQRARAAA